MKDLPEPAPKSPTKTPRPKVIRKKKADSSAEQSTIIEFSDETIEAPADLISEIDSVATELLSIHGGDIPSPKKKKRRRRGKGNKAHLEEKFGNAPVAAPVVEFASHTDGPASAQRQAPPNASLDSEEVAKRAWKIFLAEVSEEGVALIRDQDARELSKRCFRLAEIFIEEQNRRR